MAKPPLAEARAHDVAAPFGATRNDEYYWLRDDARQDPEMLAYLAAENAHADDVLADSKPLAEALYGEIVGRIKQDDASVPYRLRGYWYYSRYETGKDYPIVARRKESMQASEEILLDENAMAAGHEFFSISESEVSQDNRLLAWAEDTIGRRQYTLRVKDIATGEVLSDAIPNAEANIVWGDDNRTLYYVEKDPLTLLSTRVKAHVLGTPVAQDRLVYEEPDDSFYLHIERSRDDRYLLITSDSTVSTEVRYAPADGSAPFAVLAPRRRDFEYQADHLGGRWVIRTNWQARNFRLMQLPDGVATGERARWSELVPHAERRLHRGLRAVRRLHRHRGALRRPAAPAHAARGRQRRVRRLGRAGLRHGPVGELGAGHHLAALLLHFADHAGHDLRSGPGQRRTAPAQARPGARWLRPGELRHRARLGAGARRHAGAGLAGLPQGLPQGRQRAAAAVRLRQLRPVHGSRASPSPASACSTAAWSTRSRTSAAARRWAAPGTTTASC